MIKKITLCACTAWLLVGIGVPAYAADTAMKPLSPEAEAGGKHYTLCNACHNPQLNPPLAPPMFGVKRQYLNRYPEREQFIEHIVAFAKSPDADHAVMSWAVKRIGLMPPQTLSDEQLHSIAAYIWEHSFAPHCEHWQNALLKSSKNGPADDHTKLDQGMLRKFCEG